MDLLEKLRSEIDLCDKDLVAIFQKRMELVLQVLEYKRKNHLPVFHLKREQEVQKKILSNLSCDDFQKEIEELYKEIMRISRKLQSKKLFPYNIVLIGFMGTGKTTVGRNLSKMLEMKFSDADTLIEERAGMSIGQIFEAYGEDFFRSLEREIIKELSQLHNSIISCGGGVILNKDNVSDLRKKGKIILLQAGAESIYNRIKSDMTRPLLKGRMDLENIRKLLNQRKEAYYKAADIVIQTDNISIDEVSREIVVKLYEQDKPDSGK